MPELPEVETIKRELVPHLVGQRFSRVVLNWPRAVRNPSAEEFLHRLQDKRVKGIARRGKFLILELSGGDYLVLHLKMSGSLLVKQADAFPDRYTRTIFYLENTGDRKSALHFRDPRKFGAMWLVNDRSVITGHLGPEPLSEKFTAGALAAILKGRRTPIKVLLCDQSRIAGLGNMYADEALFAARIHPLKAAESLSLDDMKRLHRAIREILRKGIRDCGASVSTYSRPDGSPGWAHERFKVAHRGGQPCPRCGTTIQRLPLRGRGSYFCPRCQPLP